MSKQRTYQYCEVFYKTDDTPGWKIARMAGDKQLVEEKCKKLWSFYKIRNEWDTSEKKQDCYPFILDAHYTHMMDYLIYSSESDKWFFPDENIPNPISKCPIYNKFDIDYDLYDEYCTIDELKSTLFERFNGREAVEITADVTFKAGSMHYITRFLYAHYYFSAIVDFLDSIENNPFSYFEIEEYWYTKILVWTFDDKCRVKIQNYQKETVTEPVDFITSKDVCIQIFTNFFDKLNNDYTKLEKKTLDSLTEEDINFLREQHQKYKELEWHYKF